MTLSSIATAIKAERGKGSNLSSAIRVYILRHFRTTMQELTHVANVPSVAPQGISFGGHRPAFYLPGALNIQVRALKGRLSELDPKQEIVAYCRGRYCVMSYEAVAMLRAKGFKVRRLEDGMPEWRAAGLPVVTEGK